MVRGTVAHAMKTPLRRVSGAVLKQEDQTLLGFWVRGGWAADADLLSGAHELEEMGQAGVRGELPHPPSPPVCCWLLQALDQTLSWDS